MTFDPNNVIWTSNDSDGFSHPFTGPDGKEIPSEWTEVDMEEAEGWLYNIGFITTKIEDK